MNQLQLIVGVLGGPTGQVNIPSTLPSTDFPANGEDGISSVADEYALP